MNVLILHAHPEPKSFTSTLKNIALEHFQNKGNNVIVKDLYEEQFNPVGGKNDFRELANPDYFSYLKEQMNSHIKNLYSDDLKKEMDLLVWADFILLNFPLWWSSMPAIMKGWFDRVVALGFAYHPKDKLYETGIYRGKKAMICSTCGGSKEAYSPGGANGDINEVIYHIQHGLLYYIGMDVYPPFFAWKAHLVPPEILNNYIKEYKIHLENLPNFKPIF